MLMELDHSKFPECDGGVAPPAQKQIEPQANLGASLDSGNTIDVLVVYTEAVKNAVGGDTQAQNLAQSSIDITNTAYLNSKITQRLRLVHSEQSALTEANTLGNLRADAATQQLRNEHNADVVAMLVNTLGGCGVGYVMTNVSTNFASAAYSITRRSCAVGNLTFAHELGHNMGSTHDPANGGSAAYGFSYRSLRQRKLQKCDVVFEPMYIRVFESSTVLGSFGFVPGCPDWNPGRKKQRTFAEKHC